MAVDHCFNKPARVLPGSSLNILSSDCLSLLDIPSPVLEHYIETMLQPRPEFRLYYCRWGDSKGLPGQEPTAVVL